MTMKLASFSQDGVSSFGVVRDGLIIDGPRALAGRATTLREALERGLLDELASVYNGHDGIPINAVELLPPVPEPSKILCVGVNYTDHREESGFSAVPEHPTIFTRFADTHVGHGVPIALPTLSNEIDYEGEVALIIGRPLPVGAHGADLARAIAGLSCYNDLSVRDWQFHNTQWVPGKNFYGLGAFGPWMVTMDEFPDLGSVHLTTRINGKICQSATLDQLIFNFEDILRYVTSFTPLAPGDVILTGTPGGVGMAATPPMFLKPGDVAEVAVTGIGTLRSPLVAGSVSVRR